jgi:large subunit ribosomal protein L18e
MIKMKNKNTQALIQNLRKAAIEQQSPVWKRVAEDLDKPVRQRRIVNIFKINSSSNDGETVVVPGKVLGEGELTKKVTVVAQSASDEARAKISKTGQFMLLSDFVKKNPKPQKVRLLG